ncbi:MAG TPA: PfkB family carbohydrate kinase [Actinomycetota bacterium]|nr:PfkB family carbohydrate kinase [Actinomycetota bacterium]
MRVAVVGHVEWITFARVERVPAAGAIAHASETWVGAGGGGGVASRQLAKLCGSCDLFTALGRDDTGERSRQELEDDVVVVYSATRREPTRKAVCLIDERGERTITTLGPRLEARGSDRLPWHHLERSDAVYVTAGDDAAIRHARAARVLVVSTRHLEALEASGVRADALVGSDRDPAERHEPDGLALYADLVVLTQGADGGRFRTADGRAGRYEPVPAPGPIVDTYGSGDSFQAGLTYALGAGMTVDDALGLAARCGAAALTGRGPAGGQLTAADL